MGTVEEDSAAWLGDALVLVDCIEGVKVTPTNADPTTDEKDALTSEGLLLGAAPELELEVVVVVIAIVVENGEGVNVLPTKATPADDEYDPLAALEELDEIYVSLELTNKDELITIADDVVEVTVLVMVPGVGVI